MNTPFCSYILEYPERQSQIVQKCTRCKAKFAINLICVSREVLIETLTNDKIYSLSPPCFQPIIKIVNINLCWFPGLIRMIWSSITPVWPVLCQWTTNKIQYILLSFHDYPGTLRWSLLCQWFKMISSFLTSMYVILSISIVIVSVLVDNLVLLHCLQFLCTAFHVLSCNKFHVQWLIKNISILSFLALSYLILCNKNLISIQLPFIYFVNCCNATHFIITHKNS